MSFSANDITLALEDVEPQDPNAPDYWEKRRSFDDGHHFFADGGTLAGIEGTFSPVDSQSASYWDMPEGASSNDCWYVVRHNETGRMFLRTGYYSSYEGYEWHGRVREVEQETHQISFNVYTENGKVLKRGAEL